MKKLTLFAALMVSSLFATSIQKTALDSIELPLMAHADARAKIVRVADQGEVFGGVCKVQGSYPRPAVDYFHCEWKTIKFFSAREMNDIRKNIDKARHGFIQHPDPRGIHCLAMPTISETKTAANGTVFLSSGTHPCGSYSFNTSVAASKLIEELNRLHSELNRLFDLE